MLTQNGQSPRADGQGPINQSTRSHQPPERPRQLDVQNAANPHAFPSPDPITTNPADSVAHVAVGEGPRLPSTAPATAPATASALWQRIVAFEFDESGTTLTFAARLAREQRWSRSYTERVIAEYRRFLYLAAASGHPVSPSPDVDEAWHLHLTYTRSYWDRLCPKVLKRPLHHEPTRGGRDESAKFTDWYQRTKASYAAAFGHQPPTDIWPETSQRPNPAAGEWIDRRRYWLIPKGRIGRWLSRRPTPQSLTGKVVGAAVLAGAGVGCTSQTGGGSASAILIIVVAVVLIGVVAAVIVAALRRFGRSSSSHTGSTRSNSDGCGGFMPGLWVGSAASSSSDGRGDRPSEAHDSAQDPSAAGDCPGGGGDYGGSGSDSGGDGGSSGCGGGCGGGD